MSHGLYAGNSATLDHGREFHAKEPVAAFVKTMSARIGPVVTIAYPMKEASQMFLWRIIRTQQLLLQAPKESTVSNTEQQCEAWSMQSKTRKSRRSREKPLKKATIDADEDV